MSIDAPFDGKVNLRHTVEYCETISVFEYNMRIAAKLMNEEEQKKVMAYIKRLTKNRLPLYDNNGAKKYTNHRHINRKQ